jgi:hypothetical protein
MSLTRLAMRVAAARALKGNTLAEGRVFDSAVDPIDQAIKETRQPLIVLTTDDHESTVTGRDMIMGEHECSFVIEIAIGSRVKMETTDASGSVVSLAFPHTDEGMEITLDVLEHQVVSALTRDDNGWSRAWMNLVPKITKKVSRRGASAENGVRFAARQIVLTCDLIGIPQTGKPISKGTPWSEILAAFDADEALQPLALVLRSEIEGVPLTDWRSAAATLGVPLAGADMVGIGPIIDLDADPGLSQSALTGNGNWSMEVGQE